MLCCGVRLAAQDVEYDYRIYKYYDEPQDAELWLRGVAQDSVVRDVDMMLFRQPATSACYALTALGYMPRGVGREGDSYGVSVTKFAPIWQSFVNVNTRYTEAKQRYDAYTLEEIIEKLFS
jgi:hypothetical protein